MTFVYKCRDADGGWIYVGVDGSGTRLSTHSKHAVWWPRVATIEIEHFTNRPAALERESALIAEHQPSDNTIGVTGRGPMPPLVRPGVLSASGIGYLLGLSSSWVVKHADELGGCQEERDGGLVWVFEHSEFMRALNEDADREAAARKAEEAVR